MKNIGTIPVPDPAKAFRNFERGLSRALQVSKVELAARVEQELAAHKADRIELGHAKRGRKPKVVSASK